MLSIEIKWAWQMLQISLGCYRVCTCMYMEQFLRCFFHKYLACNTKQGWMIPNFWLTAAHLHMCLGGVCHGWLAVLMAPAIRAVLLCNMLSGRQ